LEKEKEEFEILGFSSQFKG